MDRRRFLIGSAVVGGCAAVPVFFGSTLGKNQWLVSACSDNQGQHFVAAVDQYGAIMSQVPLPGRAHDVLSMPGKPGHGLVFARRPGMYAMEVDFTRSQVTHTVEAEEDSRFYGHGALSLDGQLLFTTENNFQQAKGQIVVRATDTYQIVARYDSGGVGPHECMLMPDGKTLVIANGGIQTHPDQPRSKLNLDSMAPNLSYMDSSTGEIVETAIIDSPQSSIRHLDVSADGRVFVGLQYQGPSTDLVPLAFCHHSGQAPRFLQADMALWQQLNHYTASVCVDESLRQVAISCPRADKITLWDLDDEAYKGQIKFRDTAGLAMVNRQLTASNGKGQLWEGIERTDTQAQYYQGLRWDNHMTAITAV